MKLGKMTKNEQAIKINNQTHIEFLFYNKKCNAEKKDSFEIINLIIESLQ